MSPNSARALDRVSEELASVLAPQDPARASALREETGGTLKY